MSGTKLFDDTADAPAAELGITQDAASFSNTTAGPLTLTDVQLKLDDAAPSDGGYVEVDLYSDSDLTPDTEIATLGTIADSSLGILESLIDVPISNGPTLAAGTRYWIVLTAMNGSGANWALTDQTAGTGVASEYYSLSMGQGSSNSTGAFIMDVTAACFAAGTRILTVDGEVAVESLRVGDCVAVVREGGFAEVRWIGHRNVDCRRHMRPRDVWPVRVAPGAFGPGRPRRELFLSPDHAVYVTGEALAEKAALVPIRYLCNGATIVQTPVDWITYYHVELDRHDVLLAEGLGAESYLDTGNRSAFSNGGAAIAAHPDFALRVWDREACAPLVRAGAALASVRARLRDAATALGFTQTTDPDLHLDVDGRRIDGTRDGASYRFAIPSGADEIWLASRAWRPAEVDDEVEDARSLGVAIARMTLDGVPVIPREGRGWHTAEQRWQWTDGRAAIPHDGAAQLCVTLALTGRYWLHPASPRRGLARAA